jgi:hypothetical protein
VCLGLGNDDELLSFSCLAKRERDDVARSDSFESFNGKLDLFGLDVTATENEHVFPPTAHYERLADEIAPVAGT